MLENKKPYKFRKYKYSNPYNMKDFLKDLVNTKKNTKPKSCECWLCNEEGPYAKDVQKRKLKAFKNILRRNFRSRI